MRCPTELHRALSRVLVGIAGAVAIAGAAACDTDPIGLDAIDYFPREMRLTAEATGWVGAHLITCGLDWIVEVEPRDGDLHGVAGGEAYREVVDITGAGISFWADAHSETRIRVVAGGGVSVTAFQGGAPMPPVTDSRFWESVRVLRGEVGRVKGVLAEGEWRCPPMDTRGDDAGTVPGWWRLVPR